MQQWALSKLLMEECKAATILAPFSILVRMEEPSSDCTLCLHCFHRHPHLLPSQELKTWAKLFLKLSSTLVCELFVKWKSVLETPATKGAASPKTQRPFRVGVLHFFFFFFFLHFFLPLPVPSLPLLLSSSPSPCPGTGVGRSSSAPAVSPSPLLPCAKGFPSASRASPA